MSGNHTLTHKRRTLIYTHTHEKEKEWGKRETEEEGERIWEQRRCDDGIIHNYRTTEGGEGGAE